MITQRLVNKFPIWTKTRLDPSSLGQRLFSTWGEYFDFAYAENKKLLEDYKLLKHGLGVGYLYQVALDEEDALESTVLAGGAVEWTYPVVTGTVGAATYTIDRVISIEDLYWSQPTRISAQDTIGVNNLVVYTDTGSGTPTSNEIDKPDNLVVRVYDSTNYYRRTQLRNPRASGQHIVIIKGKDINNSQFTEYVYITDDGYYRTKNIVKEITEVIREGFNGTIEISLPGNQDYIVDPFHTAVTEETEGPAKLQATVQTGATNHTRLYYFTDLIKRGDDYRDGSVEVSPNEVEVWEQYLLDDTGAAIEAVDIAINPNTVRLYALDTTGKVHVYDPKPSPFSAPVSEDDRVMTKTTYIDVLPLKPWARYEETMKLFTRYTRIRFPIRSVAIKRASPTGVITYLQADKSWAAGYYEFLGTFIDEGLPEDSWTDFQFDSTFNEFGQWEFYAITETDYDTTVSYTGVMVDSLNALVSISTDVLEPVSLYFSHDDRLMIVSSVNAATGEAYTVHPFVEHSDVYLVDESASVLYLRESYDTIEVT